MDDLLVHKCLFAVAQKRCCTCCNRASKLTVGAARKKRKEEEKPKPGKLFTHVSPEFLLRGGFSEPALEDDLPAAHVCFFFRSKKKKKKKDNPSPEHDGSWGPARSLCCRRSALTAAARSPHWMAVRTRAGGPKTQPLRLPGRCWVFLGTLCDCAAEESTAEKLHWCGVRKCQSASAVCFPNSHHAHRGRDGLLGWTGWKNSLQQNDDDDYANSLLCLKKTHAPRKL